MDRLSRERARQISDEREQEALTEERPAAENVSGEHLAPGVYVEETSFAGAPLEGSGNHLDVIADGDGELDPGPSISDGNEPLGYSDSFGQIGVRIEDGSEAQPSPYIGETEKNLTGQLDGAQPAEANLLFDEADALFGKRTEVQDSHDRFANQEINSQAQQLDVMQDKLSPQTGLLDAARTDADSAEASILREESGGPNIQSEFVEVPADAAPAATAASWGPTTQLGSQELGGDEIHPSYQERIATEAYVQEPAAFTYEKIEWNAVEPDAPGPEANLLEAQPEEISLPEPVALDLGATPSATSMDDDDDPFDMG